MDIWHFAISALQVADRKKGDTSCGGWGEGTGEDKHMNRGEGTGTRLQPEHPGGRSITTGKIGF